MLSKLSKVTELAPTSTDLCSPFAGGEQYCGMLSCLSGQRQWRQELTTLSLIHCLHVSNEWVQFTGVEQCLNPPPKKNSVIAIIGIITVSWVWGYCYPKQNEGLLAKAWAWCYDKMTNNVRYIRAYNTVSNTLFPKAGDRFHVVVLPW